MAHAETFPHSVNGSHAHVDEHAAEPRSLDDLSSLTAIELAQLYASGKPPQLGVLAGPARGRLLSVPFLSQLPFIGGFATAAVRMLGAARFMPWRGKTFSTPSESHKTSGRNRILDFEALPFDAHVEKSALDHEQTLVIKYARPENPWPLNVVVDELREVGRGVYLGPAYVRGPNGPVVLLWWGCVKA